MRKNSFRGIVFLASGMLLACCCVLLALLLLMDGEDTIGQASPRLGAMQRIFLSGYLRLFADDLDKPAGDPGIQYDLEIDPGENATTIVARLTAAGVLQNDVLFRSYLQYRGLDTEIEAGHYSINGGMSLREIANMLQRAQPENLTLTILEGWRREQIAEAVSLSGMNITIADFLLASNNAPDNRFFSDAVPVFATLEGFLFPDTYAIDPDFEAIDFVEAMLTNFESRVGEQIRTGMKNQGLDIYQGVTFASIVEREAVVDDERGLIAAVFLNRFALGMKLEADPTVQYALGQQPDGGWWKAPLSLADLQIDSPFNTYLYPGLPRGPIANPGLEAIQAVANPEETPYLYFRAMCDGSGRHAFATTFEEHQGNACQ
jgi:UPF0755 protein